MMQMTGSSAAPSRNSSIWRRALPDVLGVAWLVAAGIALLVPALIHGTHIGTYDLLSRHGLSTQSRVIPHNYVNNDQIDEMIPWSDLVWTQVHQGHLPLWNSYNGLGLPLAFNWQSAPMALSSLVGYLAPVQYAYDVGMIVTLIVAGTGVFVLGRVLRLGVLACVFAGVVFGIERTAHRLAWLSAQSSHVLGWVAVRRSIARASARTPHAKCDVLRCRRGDDCLFGTARGPDGLRSGSCRICCSPYGAADDLGQGQRPDIPARGRSRPGRDRRVGACRSSCPARTSVDRPVQPKQHGECGPSAASRFGVLHRPRIRRSADPGKLPFRCIIVLLPGNGRLCRDHRRGIGGAGSTAPNSTSRSHRVRSRYRGNGLNRLHLSGYVCHKFASSPWRSELGSSTHAHCPECGCTFWLRSGRARAIPHRKSGEATSRNVLLRRRIRDSRHISLRPWQPSCSPWPHPNVELCRTGSGRRRGSPRCAGTHGRQQNALSSFW